MNMYKGFAVRLTIFSKTIIMMVRLKNFVIFNLTIFPHASKLILVQTILGN